jgi:hypothetical protein
MHIVLCRFEPRSSKKSADFDVWKLRTGHFDGQNTRRGRRFHRSTTAPRTTAMFAKCARVGRVRQACSCTDASSISGGRGEREVFSTPKTVDFDCRGQARSIFSLPHVRAMHDHTNCRTRPSLVHSAHVFLRRYELCSSRKYRRRDEFELKQGRFRPKFHHYFAGRAGITELLTRYPANRRQKKTITFYLLYYSEKHKLEK